MPAHLTLAREAALNGDEPLLTTIVASIPNDQTLGFFAELSESIRFVMRRVGSGKNLWAAPQGFDDLAELLAAVDAPLNQHQVWHRQVLRFLEAGSDMRGQSTVAQLAQRCIITESALVALSADPYAQDVALAHPIPREVLPKIVGLNQEFLETHLDDVLDAQDELFRRLVIPAGDHVYLTSIVENIELSTCVEWDEACDENCVCDGACEGWAIEFPRVPLLISAGILAGKPIPLVARTYHDPVGHDGPQTVRGWFFDGSEFTHLSADEIRSAFSHDAATGEAIEPDPGTEYADAWPINFDLPATAANL